MPIKGLNTSEPSVEIRGLCSVINISRCPTNTDLRSGLWSSIVNQTSLKYVMNFSEKFTLFRKVPLQFWRNTTQISSGSSCFGKVDPHSRVEIILFLVLTLLQKLHFSRTLTPQLWNSNNGWRCYALLNWKFILIKSRRGISLNIPCKHFFLKRADLVNPYLAISGLQNQELHRCALTTTPPDLLSWTQLSLLSFSWSLEPPSKELRRWESKYSFQMTLYIENSYLPSIFWDFQIVFIGLIITQSPGNSYCSTVPASLSFLHHPLQLRYRSLSV